MSVALRVVKAHGGRPVIGGRHGRIEGRTGRHTGRRVEREVLGDQRGGVGFLVTGIDHQIGQHAIDQITVSINAIAHQVVAGAIDHITRVIDLESTGPRIQLAAPIIHDEVATAIDRQVETVIGVRNIALRELLSNIGRNDAAANRVASRAKHATGIEIGKLGARILETCGSGVGNVVARYVQIRTGRLQTT